MPRGTREARLLEAGLPRTRGRDEVLGGIIGAYRGENLASRGDAFGTLARSIVGQQISVKAAASIWARLEGEVEAVVASHPAVASCVVAVLEDKAGEKALAAYYEPSGAPNVAADALRAYVKDRLPEFMLPSAWVEMAEIR